MFERLFAADFSRQIFQPDFGEPDFPTGFLNQIFGNRILAEKKIAISRAFTCVAYDDQIIQPDFGLIVNRIF